MVAAWQHGSTSACQIWSAIAEERSMRPRRSQRGPRASFACSFHSGVQSKASVLASIALRRLARRFRATRSGAKRRARRSQQAARQPPGPPPRAEAARGQPDHGCMGPNPPAARRERRSRGPPPRPPAAGGPAQNDGRLAEAVPIYEDVLRQVPNHPDALHLSGLAALAAGDAVKAKELVERASSLRPNDPTMLSI